jgi:glucose/arabinose dehydrogenase
LRINRDGSIPADNPYFRVAQGKNRAIWATGLRNPYWFAFQPGTGKMLINDVGEVSWEEINVGRAGSDYGWPQCEGPCRRKRFVDPIHAYSHTGGACAIAGGTFYNPARVKFPRTYVGAYFFVDWCGGWIKALDPATGRTQMFASNLCAPVQLATAPDGRLYHLSHACGSLHAIDYRPQE